MESTTAIIIAISSAITAVLAVVATKGVDAWLKVRSASREDNKASHGSTVEDLRYIIGQLQGRVTVLEADLKSVHQEHLACVQKQGELIGVVAQLRSDLTECVRK